MRQQESMLTANIFSTPDSSGRVFLCRNDDYRIGMPLSFYPEPGRIVLCNYDTGFLPPEMRRRA